MPAPAAPVLDYAPPAPSETRYLIRQVLLLALPVLAENILHMLVGLNDTYLANHLPTNAPAAGAAVGTITYFLWFLGLIIGAVGTGSTALISRARGARHRSLSNNVCGQSISLAAIGGVLVGIVLLALASPLIQTTGLLNPAPALALSYLRMLSLATPFTFVMLIAGACQRGDGDTVTPAVVMIVVDIVNMLCSFALTRGWWGLPVMGFNGIALGTIIAYVAGGVIQFIVLLRGRARMKLYLHRLAPHWHTLVRLTRIGAPAAAEGIIQWLANFGVMWVINSSDPTNAAPNAHMNTVRLESISFMTGFAFATAAATLVGQSLGMKRPDRAKKSAYISYILGGSVMTFMGLIFIFLGQYPARWLSPADEHIAALTRSCLRITGFIQSGFAAAAIFGGALRGAGDTLGVMITSLATVLLLRMVGVILIGHVLHLGLPAIWCVLAGELFLRGVFIYLRFARGKWLTVNV